MHGPTNVKSDDQIFFVLSCVCVLLCYLLCDQKQRLFISETFYAVKYT